MKLDLTSRDGTRCAKQAEFLHDLIKGARTQMTEGPEQDLPLHYRFTLGFEFDYGHPFFTPFDDGFIYSASDLALDLAKTGDKFMRHICNGVISRALKDGLTTPYPIAISAFGCPGSEEDCPRVDEYSHVEAVLVLSKSLKGAFEEFGSDNSYISRFKVGAAPLLFVHQLEVEYSDLEIARSVDHLMKFSRTSLSMAGSYAAVAPRVVNAPGFKGGEPSLEPTRTGADIDARQWWQHFAKVLRPPVLMSPNEIESSSASAALVGPKMEIRVRPRAAMEIDS